MRKISSFVMVLCMVSCSTNQIDVNVVDMSSAETDSSTTKIDENSPMKTKYIWRNSLGEEYPVYINNHGSCFIIKKSKSGKSYRVYMSEEINQQIAYETGS
jgi:hypothetical protein